MKIEDIQKLTDAELEQVGAWCLEEAQHRARQRRQDAIARIKELAASAGVPVNIGGQRGRPRRPDDKGKGGKK